MGAGTDGVAIRPALDADLDAAVEVCWVVAEEGRWLGREVPFDRAELRAALAARLASPTATVLVADPDGSGPVGYLSISVAPYGVADLAMALLGGYRGRGLGTALLDAATAWAAGAGAHKLSLEVWPDNAPALALYRRAGFVEEGRRRRHYRRRDGSLWDSILMGRPLPSGDPAGPSV